MAGPEWTNQVGDFLKNVQGNPAPVRTPKPAHDAGPAMPPVPVPSPEALARLEEGRNLTDRPASDYAKMGWGEYLGEVASNVPGSTWEAVKGIGNAVIHPIDTGTAIGKLGYGLGSKAVGAGREALGYDVDQTEAAEREAVADALINSYKNRYGGGEEGEFWKRLAEDPASYVMDVGTIATGGAGAATKLGLIDKAGTVAKTASRLGTITDPAQLGIAAARRVVPAVGSIPRIIAREGQSFASGVPREILDTAYQAGRNGNPEQVSAFMQGLRGSGNMTKEIIDTLDKAVDDMADAASAEYMSSASTAFARSQPVNMTLPQVARDNLDNLLYPKTILRAPVTYSADDLARATDALSQIENALTHPNPAGRTIQELDVIKKNIDRLARQIKDPSLQGRVSAVSGSLVDAMSDLDPVYGNMMRGWAAYRDQLNNVRRDFGSERMSDASRLGKLNRAMGKQSADDMFAAIEGTPAGKNLRFTLAGRAQAPWFSDRTHTGLSALAGGGLGYLMSGHPMALGAAVPALAASSPRLNALTQYNLGRTARGLGAVGDFTARYPLGQPVTNVASQFGSAMYPTEDRVERRAGGRVGVDHEKLADGLVRAAEGAKKGISRGTEALLDTPDDHIASALHKANEAL